MKRISTIALVVLAVALVALYAAGRFSGITLKAADNGKTLPVAKGEVITLTLDSNVTTGYKWNLTTKPDPAVLELAGAEYKSSASMRAGAGGTEVWTFKAVGPGSTTVKLGYFRPDQNLSRGAQEYSFTVVVK